MLSLGWGVVLPEYRLAPADLAPAAIEDAVCAARWVAKEAATYGYDPRQLITAGYSAGGHLALMVALLSGSETFARNCPGGPTPRPAFAVNFAGITDVAELVEGPLLRDWAVTWVGQVQLRASFIDSLSPISWVRPSSPPILTVHGTIDSTVPYGQAVRFHASLDQNTISNHLLTLTQVGHDDMFSQPGSRWRIDSALIGFARDHAVTVPSGARRR
jgi:acetyl esterase/lipase